MDITVTDARYLQAWQELSDKARLIPSPRRNADENRRAQERHHDALVRTVFAQAGVRVLPPPQRPCVACSCDHALPDTHTQVWECPAYGAPICSTCCEYDDDAPGGLREHSDAPCVGCPQYQPHRWESQTDQEEQCARCAGRIIAGGWAALFTDDGITERWEHSYCAALGEAPGDGIANAGRYTGPEGEDRWNT